MWATKHSRVMIFVDHDKGELGGSLGICVYNRFLFIELPLKTWPFVYVRWARLW